MHRHALVPGAMVMALLVVLVVPAGQGFVFRQPPEEQDGILKPITFQFTIDSGEPLTFGFEANTTMNYTIRINSSTHVNETSGSAMEFGHTFVLYETYTFNITMVAADPGVAGVDISVRYTYKSALGRVLSSVMIVVAAVLVAGFLFVLIAKGRPRLASKVNEEVAHDG